MSCLYYCLHRSKYIKSSSVTRACVWRTPCDQRTHAFVQYPVNCVAYDRSQYSWKFDAHALVYDASARSGARLMRIDRQQTATDDASRNRNIILVIAVLISAYAVHTQWSSPGVWTRALGARVFRARARRALVFRALGTSHFLSLICR